MSVALRGTVARQGGARGLRGDEAGGDARGRRVREEAVRVAEVRVGIPARPHLGGELSRTVRWLNTNIIKKL